MAQQERRLKHKVETGELLLSITTSSSSSSTSALVHSNDDLCLCKGEGLGTIERDCEDGDDENDDDDEDDGLGDDMVDEDEDSAGGRSLLRDSLGNIDCIRLTLASLCFFFLLEEKAGLILVEDSFLEY